MAKRRKEWPQKVTVGSVTVKIYEVAHPSNATGKAYVVAYVTPTGRKTIKFSDPAKALDEARLQAGKLAAGKVEAADMTGGEREELFAARKLAGDVAVLSALREWKDARALCGGQLLTAVRFYADHVKSTERKTILVRDAVTKFLTAKKQEGVNTRASYEKVLPRLRDGALGELPIDSVGKDALGQWIRDAYAVNGKIDPLTFNTVRKRFVTLWGWCRTEGFLPKLAQTAAQEVVSRKDKNEAPIGILSLGGWRDALHLIRAEAPHLLANLVIGGFCGLRRSELMAQKWADIDLVRGHLRVTKAKARTPSRRLVPLPEAAREWLLLCLKDGETIGPGWGIDHVRARVKSAGIECPDNALRHSFITYRCAASGSVDKTAQEAGNSPKVVFAHYRELVTPEDGEAWFAVRPGDASNVVAFSKEAAS
ncbi:MAG: hypothetical protein EAZ36_07240 [Verrucomicrobia bacterium]|nr:MAG: hypothetical protein EAZ36_07240 [Verrucomicrobiota bacterium]